MNRYKTVDARRDLIKEWLLRGDPKITNYKQLADMLNAEGYRVTNNMMISNDMRHIGVTKVQGEGGMHYVLTGPNISGALDAAVSESQARSRLHFAGVKVTNLSGLVPLHVQTLDAFGHSLGQAFIGWKPLGCHTVLSGHDGIILFVEPEHVERVTLMLHNMMTGG